MLAISSVSGNDYCCTNASNVCHCNIMQESPGLAQTDVFDCWCKFLLYCGLSPRPEG